MLLILYISPPDYMRAVFNSRVEQMKQLHCDASFSHKILTHPPCSQVFANQNYHNFDQSENTVLYEYACLLFTSILIKPYFD